MPRASSSARISFCCVIAALASTINCTSRASKICFTGIFTGAAFFTGLAGAFFATFFAIFLAAGFLAAAFLAFALFLGARVTGTYILCLVFDC